jgi:hypothetical protein
VIDHRSVTGVTQAISGLRYLLQNGQIPSYLDGIEPQYTEGHSRSIHALDASGCHLCLTSAGRYPNQGLTLKQAAVLMKQYGAVIAFDSGGGGDVTEVIDGQLTNIPENIDASGNHLQRALPQFLLTYTKNGGSSMNGKAKEALGNVSTVRLAPSRYGTDAGRRIAAYSTIEFMEIVPVSMMGSADAIGDKWLKLPDGTYVNYVLAGKTYYTILSQPTTDPEPETPPEGGTLPATFEHTLVAKDSAGNTLATYKGTLSKQ